MDLAFLSFHGGQRATTQSVASAVSRAVDSGVLLAGDKMPSSRELALRLGVSRTIVVRAFDDLIARGYLNALKGSGTVVSHAVASPAVAQEGRRDFSPGDDREFGWSDHHSLNAKRILSSPLSEADVLDRVERVAVPSDLLPLSEWRAIESSILKQDIANKSIDGSDVFGYSPLRNEIAQYLRRTKSIVCHPDQIVVYPSSHSALEQVSKLLVAPGQIVVCENPGHPNVRHQFEIHGADVIASPVDEDGLLVEPLKELRHPAHWLYVTPACQESTGVTLSQPRRQAILDWCRANDTAIIEDACDSDFRYGGTSPPPLFVQDANGSVIYLYNFERLLSPLSSIAIAVLPKALVPLFRRANLLCDRKAPTLDHFVLTAMLASGQLEKHMRSLWKEYRSRRQSLMFELKRKLTDRITICSRGAGMQFIVQFAHEYGEEQILRSAGTAALPLSTMDALYVGRPPRNQFIVNFADVENSRCEQVVANFVDELERETSTDTQMYFNASAEIGLQTAIGDFD